MGVIRLEGCLDVALQHRMPSCLYMQHVPHGIDREAAPSRAAAALEPATAAHRSRPTGAPGHAPPPAARCRRLAQLGQQGARFPRRSWASASDSSGSINTQLGRGIAFHLLPGHRDESSPRHAGYWPAPPGKSPCAPVRSSLSLAQRRAAGVTDPRSASARSWPRSWRRWRRPAQRWRRRICSHRSPAAPEPPPPSAANALSARTLFTPAPG